MPKLLITYASKHGHTAKIAARVAEVARAEGASVDLHDLTSGPDPDITAYDVVLVGTSVHAGHHNQDLVHWV